MKVVTKLSIGFAVVLVLLAAIAGLGLYNMATMNTRLAEITETNNVESKLAVILQSSVTDRMIALRNLTMLSSDSEIQPEIQRIKTQESIYTTNYAELVRMFNADPGTSEEDRRLVAAIKNNEEQAAPIIAKAIALGLARQRDDAARVLIDELRPKQRAWVSALNALVDSQEKQNQAAALDGKSAYNTGRTVTLIIGGMSILAGLAAAIVITRGLLGQLGGEPALAMEMAREISAGNLTLRMPLKPSDDRSLMASLEKMRVQLNAIVTEIQTSGKAISSAASEIAQGTVDLSQRTEEQAASLEQTAASMEELASTVKFNAENAAQGNHLAIAASNEAAAGGAVVTEVVGTMREIAASSAKMSDIIAVIEGIAFQTNILALNAAVEAARAGEQGRGFAVVASEVRALAQRSGGAAKEIKELISQSVSRVETGSQLVEKAGQTITDIVGSVERVTGIMGQVSSASAQQRSGIEQVNIAVTQMDDVTQQNAALVEQASAAAQAMAEQANALQRAVGVFRVDALAAA